MEASPAREKGVENWGYVLEVLKDELALVTGDYVRTGVTTNGIKVGSRKQRDILKMWGAEEEASSDDLRQDHRDSASF
jgi:hypothetical protein